MSSLENQEPEFKTTIFSEPKTRRSAIKSIGTGMTIAALSGCASIRKPKQVIKTYNNEPDDLIPGRPNFYGTSTEIGNDVSGLIATSHEGRPTQIQGNPKHNSNKGKTSAFLQAEILNLYDPDRLKNNYINSKVALTGQTCSQGAFSQ